MGLPLENSGFGMREYIANYSAAVNESQSANKPETVRISADTRLLLVPIPCPTLATFITTTSILHGELRINQDILTYFVPRLSFMLIGDNILAKSENL